MTKLGDITSGGITTFHVDDATGKLTEIGTTPAGTLPGALTVDSSGQFLYSSDNSWYLRVYKLQPDGTPKYVRSIATRPSPMNIALLAGETPVTYTPTSVQVTTAGDNLLTGYAIGSDGTLTSAGSIGMPATPNSLALLPWGTNALVTATGAPPTSNMGAYTINPITGSPAYGLFMGDAAVAGGVVIEPGEGYAFQSDSSAGVLRTYGHFAASFGVCWRMTQEMGRFTQLSPQVLELVRWRRFPQVATCMWRTRARIALPRSRFGASCSK